MNNENLHNLATIPKEKARAIQSLGGKARVEQKRKIRALKEKWYSLTMIDNFIEELEKVSSDTSIRFTDNEKTTLKAFLYNTCINIGIIKDSPIEEKLAYKILNMLDDLEKVETILNDKSSKKKQRGKHEKGVKQW